MNGALCRLQLARVRARGDGHGSLHDGGAARLVQGQARARARRELQIRNTGSARSAPHRARGPLAALGHAARARHLAPLDGPVAFKQITELWHTRLGAGGLEPPVATPQLKAFWAPGYGGSLRPPPADPWLMSLDPHDRIDIVTLTTGTSPGEGPVEVDLLLLSALWRVGQPPEARGRRAPTRPSTSPRGGTGPRSAGTATSASSTSATSSPGATAPSGSRSPTARSRSTRTTTPSPTSCRSSTSS